MGFLSTLGKIGGGLGGFIVGGPAGAAAGVRIGGQIGSALQGGNGGRPRPSISTYTPPMTRPRPSLLPAGQGFPCPPGTRCIGLSIGNNCIGSCKPYTYVPPGPGLPQAPQPFGPQLPELPSGPVPPQSGGCACNGGRALCACCTSSGQRGRFNKTGYYVYGRCGDPAQATYIPPGTRCVSSRRINPANGRAARRAVVRLNSTLGLLRSVEKSMQKLVRSRRRRG